MAQQSITRVARIPERFHARELQSHIKTIEAMKLKTSFPVAKV
jgi:hypothetical protein